MTKEKNILEMLFHLIFPRRCVGCDAVVKPSLMLCAECEKSLITVNTPICIWCGQAENDCTCMVHKHSYDGAIAPYYYEGSARQGILKLKSNRSAERVEFFAESMVKMINREYKNVAFDQVHFVPLSKNRLRERGFNQSEQLARRVGEMLHIPVSNALVKVRQNKVQHFLKWRERQENVSGVFSVTSGTIEGNILLIDDIKTTGATLRECSEILKRSGAVGVYCVTATIVRQKPL